jgi:hypothetical protein
MLIGAEGASLSGGALAKPPRRKLLRGLAWNANEATEKVTFNKKLEFFKNQIPKTSVFHLESGDFHPVYYAFY